MESSVENTLYMLKGLSRHNNETDNKFHIVFLRSSNVWETDIFQVTIINIILMNCHYDLYEYIFNMEFE